MQLEEIDIRTIDDLAKASAKNIAEYLRVDLHIAQEWVSEAKKLQ